MTTLLTLTKTEKRPEEMRVELVNGLFLVQTLSNRSGKWITQAEHKDEQVAFVDCVKWY